MVLGPLTGGGFNPARWFGPALVGNEFASVWPFVVGPLLGALLAAAVYKFIIEPASGPAQEAADTVAPRGPAPPAGESPPLRQEHGGGPGGPGSGPGAPGGGSGGPGSGGSGGPGGPGSSGPPPSNPPGGIAGS
jgi:hypothetical protein